MGSIEPTPENAAEIVDVLTALVQHDVDSRRYEVQPQTCCVHYGQRALQLAAVPLEIGDGGTFRYAPGAVTWAVSTVRSALVAAGGNVLDADIVTALGVASPPAFVVGERGDRRLLSYEVEPFAGTRVWWTDEAPVNAFEMHETFDDPEVSRYESQAIYIPHDDQPGSVWVRTERRPHRGGRRLGPVGADGALMFPSGLSYRLTARALWVGHQDAKDELLGFLACRVDPRLTPREFATMIVGSTPPDHPHMRENMELVRIEAERFFTVWLAGGDTSRIVIETRPDPSQDSLEDRIDVRPLGASRRTPRSPRPDGQLGLAELVDAILYPHYTPFAAYTDCRYWTQRWELLLGELRTEEGNPQSMSWRTDLHLLEQLIKDLPHSVLPWEGALEVPWAFGQALMAIGQTEEGEAERLRSRLRRLQERFLTEYLKALFPGIEARTTTEARLVELGLPAEEPVVVPFWEEGR